MSEAAPEPVSYVGELKERGANNPLDATLPPRDQSAATDLLSHLLALKGQIVTAYYRGERGADRSLTAPLTGVLVNGNDTFIRLGKELLVNLNLIQFIHPGDREKHRAQNPEISATWGYA